MLLISMISWFIQTFVMQNRILIAKYKSSNLLAASRDKAYSYFNAAFKSIFFYCERNQSISNCILT